MATSLTTLLYKEANLGDLWCDKNLAYINDYKFLLEMARRYDFSMSPNRLPNIEYTRETHFWAPIRKPQRGDAAHIVKRYLFVKTRCSATVKRFQTQQRLRFTLGCDLSTRAWAKIKPLWSVSCALSGAILLVGRTF